jgi:uncharacterized LabA/DUF88 family protein
VLPLKIGMLLMRLAKRVAKWNTWEELAHESGWHFNPFKNEKGTVLDFYQNERVALFIDGASLYAHSKALGFDIDFRRLLAIFRKRAKLLRANYYTVTFSELEFSSVRPLIDWLDYNGFTVITKAAKEFADSQGRRKLKGNMDVELAVDAMRSASALDHLVIFSGDADLRVLVAALQDMGKRVSVVSTLQTHPPMVSDELRRQADQFIDLAVLEKEIGRGSVERHDRASNSRQDVEDETLD